MAKLSLAGLALPAGVRYRPVCGVVTVAAAAGVTFDEAWAALAPYYGPRWGGRTQDKHRNAALRKLGVQVSAVPIPRGAVLRVLLDRLRPHDRYIVRTTDHVQIVQNGTVLDQHGVRPIEGDWTARKRVKNIYRIIEPTEA